MGTSEVPGHVIMDSSLTYSLRTPDTVGFRSGIHTPSCPHGCPHCRSGSQCALTVMPAAGNLAYRCPPSGVCAYIFAAEPRPYLSLEEQCRVRSLPWIGVGREAGWPGEAPLILMVCRNGQWGDRNEKPSKRAERQLLRSAMEFSHIWVKGYRAASKSEKSSPGFSEEQYFQQDSHKFWLGSRRLSESRDGVFNLRV
jgi:hypothetical protein